MSAVEDGRSTARKVWATGVGAALLAVGMLTVASGPSAEAAVPPGFSDTPVISGLTNPTAVQFTSDGRVFVAQKNGRILVYDGLTDTTPTLFADLSTEVDDFWDRGLLGMALPPSFPTDRSVYVLYTFDAAIGGTAPTWSDSCPTPPGATTDGCMVSGRVAKLTASAANPAVSDGTEQVLINDWCQQFPSHSIGTLLFGNDGYLYVSGGDGASFNNADWGQFGNTYAGDQSNPCGDPPGSVGTSLQPPTAEGGALRSQSVRRASGPTTLNGGILRLDPATGDAAPGNPFSASSDPNKRRVIAYGTRNPFRMTTRPGTDELWVGDVGWSTWEEIDRISVAGDLTAENFGWPCYEGGPAQPSYQGANLTSCNSLYSTANSVTAPFYAYQHSNQVGTGDPCPTANGSSITGLAFYAGGTYPSSYTGALFFADHSRNCIWAMMPDAGGNPDPTQVQTLVSVAGHPVDLKIGPGGDLFYVDLEGGQIHRITFTAANQPPSAVVTAAPGQGLAPLTVQFDGSGSSDPEGGALAYSWDLNGDGIFGDSSAPQPTYTYTSDGVYTVQLRVTDPASATDTASTTVTVGNTPPVPTISQPSSSLRWRVGQVVSFSGAATDAQDGTVPASALSWQLVLYHCPAACHTHVLQAWTGVRSGTFTAPDHEYPSYLVLTLTATDSGQLNTSTSVRLDPQTVNLTFRTNPAGLKLTLDTAGFNGATPFTRTVIVGSANVITAPSPQTVKGQTYLFKSWSDGGAQSHTVTAPTTATTFTATYRKR
ncbi:MAG: PQQ-dependent sugar dehydrogenase [Actinomycetota bacterium]|nr:PQQ-dependent sugar dehydrogenase [Actinomycetota bacterium]